MNNNLSSMLVSKVCHDLANNLANVVFLKEDIKDGSSDLKSGMNQLINSIDNFSLVLKFFQNIAVQTEHIGNLYNILDSICKRNKINLIVENEYNLNHPYYEENIVCGILYILISYSVKQKLFYNIKVLFTQDHKIIIDIPSLSLNDLPTEIIDITKIEEVQPTVVNIFGIYIKNIMIDNHYTAYIKEKNRNEISIVICKL